MTEPVVIGLALRDDDAAPLALGRELASFLGAPLALVHIYPYEPSPRTASPPYEAALRERRTLEALERAAERLRSELDVAIRAVGDRSIVRGLHDAAIELDAALLVIGSSHRGPVRRTVPGGVGERLLHAAPCAIAVAPRGFTEGGEGIRRIGVAFVDTPEGRDALSAGAMLAMLSGAALSTFTALEPPRVGPGAATPGWVPPAPYDASSRIQEAEALVRAQLPEGLDAETTVQEGDPPGLLAEASETVDLLICGSRGYGPLRTVLLGGVSGRLAHAAACPLLVLPRAPDHALARGMRQPVA
jgi:nucleotide-binding universal stress UspA family protein